MNNEFLEEIFNKIEGGTAMNIIICPECGKKFKSLGYARHRAMHYDQAMREEEDFLQRCGSCLYFITFRAEAGFCELAECNCICRNPKAMIDIWDNKCEKWVINPDII
jgi:hypothetical protein